MVAAYQSIIHERSSGELRDVEKAQDFNNEKNKIWVHRAITISFFSNVVLFIIKMVAAVATGSLSVIASAVDSTLDLLAGLVIFCISRQMKRKGMYIFIFIF